MSTINVNTDTSDEDRTIMPFAGVTRHDDRVAARSLPANVWNQRGALYHWSKQYAGTDDPELDDDAFPDAGLNSIIPELPRATEATAGWKHPRTGEWLETEKHNAIINPETAETLTGTGTEQTDDGFQFTTQEDSDGDPDADAALYNIPTSDYEIINPSTFLRPLAEVIRDEDLGNECFGESRLSRGGGRATLDVFFDSKEVEAPNFDQDRAPVVVGLSVQWDFFGDWAVRAQGIGLDWACTNNIRRLTEREIVKHAGDIENRVDWIDMWHDLLESIDLKADQLSQIIEEASNVTLDFSELPDDIDAQHDDPWTALYAYQGLPEYLAEYAGNSLQADAEDPYNPSWWEIHSAATDAITHRSRGDADSGGAVEEQYRVANDMLMNPAGMETRIIENYEADREDRDSDLAEQGGGRAEIEAAFETVREKKDQYEERREQIQELIAGREA